MDEYIKKNELLKFKADVYDEDGHVLYAVPTGYIVAMIPADVAPVVRCRDCKHARKSKEVFEFDAVTPLCECSYMKLPHRWYEYCSWGERRKENA